MDFVATGVPNLDSVLGGGLVVGSLTMLVGPPGSGKTVLSQQLACRVATQGGRVLILTTLPEPHVKLLANLRTFDFFDERLIGERIELTNVYRQLRENFADASTTILRLAREYRATLVVIDSFDSVRALGGSEVAVKELIYELSGGLGLLGITIVVISTLDPDGKRQYDELTIADHIIQLRNDVVGARGVRTLEVAKMRGAVQRNGRHRYVIDSGGMRIYPRLEAVPLPPEARLEAARQPFDLPELDAMMGGGPSHASTTLLIGNPGTAKTILALQSLLAGDARGERGLFLSFQESEQQLVAKAMRLGLTLPTPFAAGIDFVHRVPAEFDPDELATLLRERITHDGIRLVAIDGLNELLGGLLDPRRRITFLTALNAYFRAAGVTACYVQEFSPTTATMLESMPALSVYCDNVVLLRHLAHNGELHRIISILKMRNSDHDRTLREFHIGAGGLTIMARADSTPGMLEAFGQL